MTKRACKGKSLQATPENRAYIPYDASNPLTSSLRRQEIYRPRREKIRAPRFVFIIRCVFRKCCNFAFTERSDTVENSLALVGDLLGGFPARAIDENVSLRTPIGRGAKE